MKTGGEMTDIEPPGDAVGREVPFDAEVPCTADGIEVRMDGFAHGPAIHVNESTHDIVSNGRCVHSGRNAFDVGRLHPKRPDGSKRSPGDSDRAADAEGFGCRAHAGRGGCDRPSRIAADGKACARPIMRDTASRVREPVGEDVEGRETPPGTAKPFGAGGDAHDIARRARTAGLDTSDGAAGRRRAAADTLGRLDRHIPKKHEPRGGRP